MPRARLRCNYYPACYRGADCKFRHDLNDEEFVREEFESQQMQARKVKKIKPLCKEFRREGKCGDACSMEADNAHGEKCKICKEKALHPYDATKRSEHKRLCFSKKQTCGKCQKVIWETSLQQFAILSCRHPFCLTCISEEWPVSTSATDLKCPTCQKPNKSYLVSKSFPQSAYDLRNFAEKQETEEAGCLLSSDPKVFSQQMQDRLLAMKLQREFEASLDKVDKESVKQTNLGQLEDVVPYDECVICLESLATAGFVHGESVHKCCCQDCARAIMNNRLPCPICRSQVQHLILKFH